MNFDTNTYQHFKTLSSLFKRLNIKPHDTQDNYGFNAFHYLSAFTPETLALKLANEQIKEDEEKKR